MKKTDIAMLVFIAGLSVLAAYFIVNTMIAGLKTAPVNVPTATAISTDITQPDPTIFNSGAINPTVQVNIGSGTSGQ